LESHPLFESRRRFILIDRRSAVGLLSAGSTGPEIESNDRSSVLVKGASRDCQSNLAPHFDFYNNSKVFPLQRPPLGDMLIADCKFARRG
jgi:hypothetical protein